ncbi:MAG: spore maturation protein [Clostridia bacterium]|nr:spore maturation protein [Clostridia bacterium]
MFLAILILLLLLFAAVRRVNVFEAFRDGAAQALPLIKTILPTLAVFSAAMGLFRASGAEAILESALSPVLSALGVEAPLVPLILVRPFSGGAAVGALTGLFQQYGPDSRIGLTASVLLGSSETIFYTLALYFGSVGIKKTRFTVPVALAAMLTSVVTGLLFSSLFFGSR